MITKKHIIWYSGGLMSWFSGYLAAQKYGKENILLVFADTKIEDEDLYRFLDEGANAIGCELIRLEDSRTPWDIYNKVRYINHRAAKCSYYLKFLPCWNWLNETYPDPETVNLYVGIDFNEIERLPKIKERWYPYQVSSLMCEGDDWYDRQDALKALNQCGIDLPRLYKLGFAHNNCGGFCVRAGKSQFKKLLKYFPERYNYHANKEQELKEGLGNHNIGILREQKNGKKYIVSLKEFAERVKNEPQQLSLFNDENGCGCFL